MPQDLEEEARLRQRGRNFALVAILVAFVVLLYVVSIVRIGGGF
jgi:hypothetical protein